MLLKCGGCSKWGVRKPTMLWNSEKTGRKVPPSGEEWGNPKIFIEIKMPIFLFHLKEIIIVWKIAHTRKDSPGLQALRHLGWSPGQKREPQRQVHWHCLAPWAAEADRRYKKIAERR